MRVTRLCDFEAKSLWGRPRRGVSDAIRARDKTAFDCFRGWERLRIAVRIGTRSGCMIQMATGRGHDLRGQRTCRYGICMLVGKRPRRRKNKSAGNQEQQEYSNSKIEAQGRAHRTSAAPRLRNRWQRPVPSSLGAKLCPKLCPTLSCASPFTIHVCPRSPFAGSSHRSWHRAA
jgi:hypothetical protein